MGDNKQALATVSRGMRGLIAAMHVFPGAVDRLRLQVIGQIEKDLAIAIQKNPASTVDSLIGGFVGTPDYMAMLKDLGLDEYNLKVMAKEAIDKGVK